MTYGNEIESKGGQFPGRDALDSSKISAFVPQEHQIRMCSDERDNDNNIFYFIHIVLKLYTYSKAIIKIGKH